jgi:hypothetical protein
MYVSLLMCVFVHTPDRLCARNEAGRLRRKIMHLPGSFSNILLSLGNEGNASMENWANRKTLILSRSEMIGLLKPAEYNNCVEQAYRMHGEGRFYMDPKGHIVLDRFPGESPEDGPRRRRGRHGHPGAHSDRQG